MKIVQPKLLEKKAIRFKLSLFFRHSTYFQANLQDFFFLIIIQNRLMLYLKNHLCYVFLQLSVSSESIFIGLFRMTYRVVWSNWLSRGTGIDVTMGRGRTGRMGSRLKQR